MIIGIIDNLFLLISGYSLSLILKIPSEDEKWGTYQIGFGLSGIIGVALSHIYFIMIAKRYAKLWENSVLHRP